MDHGNKLAAKQQQPSQQQQQEQHLQQANRATERSRFWSISTNNKIYLSGRWPPHWCLICVRCVADAGVGGNASFFNDTPTPTPLRGPLERIGPDRIGSGRRLTSPASAKNECDVCNVGGTNAICRQGITTEQDSLWIGD